MSTKNRGDRIQLLQKVVHKHFSPVVAPKDRTVLEHMVYASCLEDAPYDAADEVLHRLQANFFDWNEVRVTTVTELTEHLAPLPDPAAAATRVKKNLQSLFEARYSFDLEDMVKMNQGKAVAELEKLGGMSRFVLNYLIQNALGGHAIPVSASILKVLILTEIVSEPEAAKGQIPGLERAVAKSKGAEFGSCLHQFGLLVLQNPGGKKTKEILKEAGAIEQKKPKETPTEAPAKPSKMAAKPATSKPATAPAKPAATAKPSTSAKKPSTTSKGAPIKKTAPPKKPTASSKPAASSKSAKTAKKAPTKSPPAGKRKPK
jgi:endonuclease-3